MSLGPSLIEPTSPAKRPFTSIVTVGASPGLNPLGPRGIIARRMSSAVNDSFPAERYLKNASNSLFRQLAITARIEPSEDARDRSRLHHVRAAVGPVEVRGGDVTVTVAVEHVEEFLRSGELADGDLARLGIDPGFGREPSEIVSTLRRGRTSRLGRSAANRGGWRRAISPLRVAERDSLCRACRPVSAASFVSASFSGVMPSGSFNGAGPSAARVVPLDIASSEAAKSAAIMRKFVFMVDHPSWKRIESLRPNDGPRSGRPV